METMQLNGLNGSHAEREDLTPTPRKRLRRTKGKKHTTLPLAARHSAEKVGHQGGYGMLAKYV
jgi:hypothetical protein